MNSAFNFKGCQMASVILLVWIVLHTNSAVAQNFNEEELCELYIDSTKWELTGMDDYENERIWEYALRSELKGKYTQVIRLTVTPYQWTNGSTIEALYKRAVRNLNTECPGATDSEIVARGTRAIIFKTIYKERCGRQKPGTAYTRIFLGDYVYQSTNLYQIDYFFIGINPNEAMLDYAGAFLTRTHAKNK